MSQPRLIVIDDEADMAGFINDVALQSGFSVEQFNDAGLFKKQYKKGADVIVLDLMMPGVDGVEVIRFLSDVGCDALLILVSGFDPGVLHSAQKLAIEQGLNFSGSLSKPFRHMDLHRLLNDLHIEPRRKAPPSIDSCDAPTADELYSAFHNNELVVYYQPKVNLQNGAIAGLEALVRWQHPDHGLLYPNRFIPMAEQQGLIDDLTWVVLNQVAAQCHTWRNTGIELPVAVNMSANTLQELDLPERINSLVNKHAIEASQLVLEVTETALMQELTKSLDILTRLRMKGFQLSIDDFGTGYSSLVQLHRVPFSELKIDRSFVLDMANDKEACSIVEMVILLGHKLGMKVAAEGIETQANLDQLAAMGCDLGQGYHIARPQPDEAITAWLVGQPLQAALN